MEKLPKLTLATQFIRDRLPKDKSLRGWERFVRNLADRAGQRGQPVGRKFQDPGTEPISLEEERQKRRPTERSEAQ